MSYDAFLYQFLMQKSILEPERNYWTQDSMFVNVDNLCSQHIILFVDWLHKVKRILVEQALQTSNP